MTTTTKRRRRRRRRREGRQRRREEDHDDEEKNTTMHREEEYNYNDDKEKTKGRRRRQREDEGKMCYTPKSTGHGDGKRNRPAARNRTTIIDPRRRLLKTIRRRGNSKSESKQHSRSKQRHSRFAGVNFDALIR